MSMVTSCPACATTFRVTTEQLKARQGKVRCGQCLTVFDGFKALASMPDEPLPEPAPPPPPPAEPSPTLPLLDFEPPPARPAHVELAEPTTIELPASPPPVAQEHRGTYTEPPPAPPAPRGRRALWIALAIILALGLIVQATYLFRVELASAVPAARPLLERMCALAGCELQLPRRTDQLAIAGSDLQADPARPNVIVLTASLRNGGTGPVAYPALELTLTNAQDQTVARRVIAPGDYLGSRANLSGGMPPQSEIPVRLELDTGDLRPAGYRLYLFYP